MFGLRQLRKSTKVERLAAEVPLVPVIELPPQFVRTIKLTNYSEHALADAQRAIRTVRAKSEEWHVNPSKIGLMGFSAGGEVAVLAATRYDAGKPDSADPIERQGSKPDYQILIYPGVRADTVVVTKDTPPAFMLCADNDRGPATAIPALYLAFKKAGVPAEVHIYNSGGHGFGLKRDPRPNPIYSTWALRLQDWMADTGMSAVK